MSLDLAGSPTAAWLASAQALCFLTIPVLLLLSPRVRGGSRRLLVLLIAGPLVWTMPLPAVAAQTVGGACCLALVVAGYRPRRRTPST